MLKHVKITLAVFCAAAALTACKSSMKIKHLPYPEAERTEVVDNYFGTEVADPYRWLEDDRSEQTAAWVAAENAVTQNYLDQIPFREAMRARLTELWAYPWEGAPAKFGDYYYFYRNDGRQNQAVLYRQASLDAEPEVFLDPNTLSEDGTVALSGISFSEDGRYLAYAASASGSDWSDIHVIRTADQATHGRYRKMGEALQRSVDTRRKGILLQYVRRSGSGRLFFPEPISEGVLSHAR